MDSGHDFNRIESVGAMSHKLDEITKIPKK